MTRFSWDDAKNAANQKKHGVSFEEARTVFYDPKARQFYDDEHSAWEDRFLMLGMSSRLRVLLVCHCYRESEAVIRIISARRAVASERALYPG
ncbi:MAG: BrnT family toxin [Candidatus Brocadiae bacterium]|nr:BrnT family toxin [Candidatus Brocadiia bacterium]